jgi:ElaB/YqjD/DUF883 family membrane-anchored ribosome-binding protein
MHEDEARRTHACDEQDFLNVAMSRSKLAEGEVARALVTAGSNRTTGVPPPLVRGRLCRAVQRGWTKVFGCRALHDPALGGVDFLPHSNRQNITYMKNRHDTATTTETPEQLIEHISRLMAEAEAMLAGPVPEQASNRLADIRDRLEDARARLGDVYTKARKNVIAGAKYTDQTIREYPYYSIGVALGVGVLLGALIRRSNSNP